MTAMVRRLTPVSFLSPARGWRGLRNLAFANPLYGLTLIGRRPTEVRGVPADPWPGSAAAGQLLMDGAFFIGGRRVALAPDPWSADPGGGAAVALHGFSWLKDLRALGSEAAAKRAHALTAEWIAAHGRWSALPWRPDVLGERLANWLAADRLLARGGGEAFHRQLLDAAARQARHLGRVAAGAPRDARLFLAIKGLIYSGVCLPGQDNALETGLRLLEREIAHQVLPDGGHFQRGPALQLGVLRHLVDMRAALKAARVELPVALQGAIDRMAPMLRAFRHGDGRLALFNDSTEDDDRDIDMVLAQAGAKGRAHSSAPHSGYQRVNAGRTLILMDVGAPAVVEGDCRSHAGTLAFEMSVGRDRLVVNCGADADEDSAWHEALRSTAAHSTLTVDDTNSTELPPRKGSRRRASGVSCTRREADGATWIESSHDGYLGRFGLTHNRHLYLSVDGGDLRGLDTLVGSGGRAFAVRFHLHPDVRASLVQDGEAALLRMPRGGGWRFLCAGGILALEDSIYRGRPPEARRSRQLVISGPLAGEGAVVKWRFARIEAKA